MCAMYVARGVLENALMHGSCFIPSSTALLFTEIVAQSEQAADTSENQ